MSCDFEKLSGLALPLIAFYFAEPFDGNGFMAAFFAGLVFGNFARKVAKPVHEFGEAEGSLLILLTFILFGAIMVPKSIRTVECPNGYLCNIEPYPDKNASGGNKCGRKRHLNFNQTVYGLVRSKGSCIHTICIDNIKGRYAYSW